jgi:RHS repeat-associated protein
MINSKIIIKEWTWNADDCNIQQVTSIWTNNAWFVVENLKFVSDPMLFGRHIVELNATNNTLVRTYVWGLDLSGTMDGAGGVGGLAWVTLHTASGPASWTHFTCYDGNGNIVSLVSATTGDVTARYEYGPFGEPIRISGPAATLNAFRFSTKRTCNTSDLVLYEYRAYSPCLGRWMSRDPVEETGGGNLYGFVFGNPLNNFDRLGLSAGKCREAIGKNGKPRIIFEHPSPKGGWRGKLGFGDIQGSAQARMIHKIYIKWKAAVAVLCICPTGCEIRYGTRIQEDEEHGNWLVYDPTKLPQSPFPVPQSIWGIIGQLITDEILELLGPAPVPMDDNELESMKAAIRALIDRRPKCPWDGSWKGGKSPCDG